MVSKPTDFSKLLRLSTRRHLIGTLNATPLLLKNSTQKSIVRLKTSQKIPKDGPHIQWGLADFSCATSPSLSSIGNSHLLFK
jgi:hypothetical protein